MKKILLGLVLIIISIAAKFITDHTAATAQQEQGYTIFMMSKPVAAYEYLGTLTITDWGTWSGSPKELFNKTIAKAKKEYPQANGLIFLDLENKKVDAIKFKE